MLRGFSLVQGSGRNGTFTAQGASVVTLLPGSCSTLTADSVVLVSPSIVAGNPQVGNGAFCAGIDISGQTISFNSFAGDVSIYNYLVLN